MQMNWKRAVLAGIALALGCALGCARNTDNTTGAGTAPAASDSQAATTSAHDEHEHASATKGHAHDGWWCGEHGVPEEVCGLCDSKLAADLQKKGDWCKEHDRPDSQCFICHPEQEGRFAAQYEAKFGDKPPKLDR